jgi:hypothetical protein
LRWLPTLLWRYARWVRCKHEDARMGGWMDGCFELLFLTYLRTDVTRSFRSSGLPSFLCDSTAFYCRYAGRCLLSFLGFLSPRKQVLRKWQAANCDSINHPIDTSGTVIYIESIWPAASFTCVVTAWRCWRYKFGFDICCVFMWILCVCFWCSEFRFDCATSPTMAGEGQCVDRADCQVCLLKRLTAILVADDCGVAIRSRAYFVI